MIVVVSTAHPLAARAELSPADLSGRLDRHPGTPGPGAGSTSRATTSGPRCIWSPKGSALALLPELALTDAPRGVTGRPLREPRPARQLYTCRLDTRHVSTPVARLHEYPKQAATAAT